MRKQKARESLQAWAKATGRKMRNRFFINEKVLARCVYLLRKNPDDENAWYWLERILPGHAAREYELDVMLLGEAGWLEMWRSTRTQSRKAAA